MVGVVSSADPSEHHLRVTVGCTMTGWTSARERAGAVTPCEDRDVVVLFARAERTIVRRLGAIAHKERRSQ